MYKVAWIFLLLSGLRLLGSCCREKVYKFRFTDVRLQNLQVTRTQADTLKTDSSRMAAYGFRFELDFETVAKAGAPNWGFASANAWSCEQTWINVDTLQAVHVTSANRIDANHPAGADISDILVARYARSYADTLSAPYLPLTSQVPELNRFGNPSPGLDIKFASADLLPGRHRFTVTATLASGRTVSDTIGVRLY